VRAQRVVLVRNCYRQGMCIISSASS
jgi:hypothetical protein